MQPVSPFTVSFQSSHSFAISWRLVHVLAFLAIFASALPGWLVAFLLALVGASIASLHNLSLPPALMLHSDGRFVKVGAGETALELEDSSSVLGPLMLLRFRENGNMRSMVFLPDNFIFPDDMRRFRRWLTWQINRKI